MKGRFKRVVVSPEALFHVMASDTAWRVSKGIPKGAILRGMTLDPYSQTLNLFVEHESFEEVSIESVIPQLETYFKKI